MNEDAVPGSYRKILLGYDGSGNSKRALARAIEMSKESNAELAIIYFVDLVAFQTFAAKHLLKELRDGMVAEAEKLVADAALTAKRGGVMDVRTLVMHNRDPADAILSTAAEEAADLIIVGRRGVKGVERFLLGSVSSRVIDHSKCDVLVVK
ncbi:MAG TPA: universal stress protein [Nitrososphaerales archaeon]|nr:universal stress protein [Nitrososphaerales archaeon]